MQILTAHIALDETSHNVRLLHQALNVLGLEVEEAEVKAHAAGPDTVKKMRLLQTQLGVRGDDSALINEATAVAIAEAMQKRGLTSSDRSFTVGGSVTFLTRLPRTRQRLLAFDLDLRGVAAYRRAKTLAEIEKSGGVEFLGLTTSDNRGNYSLTFYDWQYQRAERKKADVVVFAVQGDDKKGRIVGHSRLVNTEENSEEGIVRDLDVVITQTDARTEYEVLMSALEAFLKESETSLLEIASSPEQLAFTASELDTAVERVDLAAQAELLNPAREQQFSHELLYGIGRQDIELEWAGLFRRKEDELRAAIAKSVEERIIREPSKRAVTTFLRALQESSARQLLHDENGASSPLSAMLGNALPKEGQRLSFLNAVATFKGTDFREFWNEHLPAQSGFKDKPKLVAGLLLTQQLALITGNHQALINELQVTRKLTSAPELLDLEKEDWAKIIRKTGVPDFVEGETDEEKIGRYAGLLQNVLNAAFPTRRIGKMVERNQLPIEGKDISESIARFLSNTPQFDFASSRVHDFGEEIEAAVTERRPAATKRKTAKAGSRAQTLSEEPSAGELVAAVTSEVMKIQRVFQVSTTPEAMTTLMAQNLHASYTIASIPQQSFIDTYAGQLGGEGAAFAIHQRASHIATGAEIAATHMMEYSHGLTPAYALGVSQQSEAMAVLTDHIPNYAELFGSPDLCECGHCRSVYSAAAYFVDLLRFLWRCPPNEDTPKKTPLDVLTARRPDLLHLLLTCENTNTIIPYIDLANEVMEQYAAKASLNGFKGHDTGNSTVQELRANPQNFNLDAYRKLAGAKPLPGSHRQGVYPFTLPYHQPLDVIRSYSDHLKVSRYEAMKAMNPLPNTKIAHALAAESLRLSAEEYEILTGFDLAGNPDSTPLPEYFGYSLVGDLEKMEAVREFLHRSGVAYTELVELVKTQFLNPFQGTVDFLQKIASSASTAPNIIYAQLKAGTFDPTADPNVMGVLNALKITPAALALWITNNFAKFKQVITLFEPDSKCNLDTTSLRTIKSIYEGLPTSGLANKDWSRIHRFIRLWRKLGWTIHETDLMLTALGESDITPGTIAKLESVSLLKAATKLPLHELAAFWGDIDTYGDKSLYQRLFLNKSAQQIDSAFAADAWGDYLQGGSQTLADHQSAILATFRIREEDFNAILKVARASGSSGPGMAATDALSLANLSAIYRHVLLARALKLSVIDLCKLIAWFAGPSSAGPTPFLNADPAETYQFYRLALSTKEAGFKPSVLEYITEGTLPADSNIGLPKEKVLQAARAIRNAFAAIEQDHPDKAPSPLTPEIITAKLALTFQPEIVSRFVGILDGTTPFETLTDKQLTLVLPGSPLITADDFTDLSGLVKTLTDRLDDVSAYLWSVFPSTTQQVLNDNTATALQQKTELVGALNPILTGSSIYDAQRFSGVTLSADTVAWQAQNAPGVDTIWLNRRLLQDAYQGKIAKTPISKKFTYVKGSGRLTCMGVMSDTEKTRLKSLANATANFRNAVDQLYAAPENLLSTHFGDVFGQLPLKRAQTYSALLNHPEQTTAPTLEEKFLFVYNHFIPILQSKLRRDAITQHIASLLGLTEEGTALLIADDMASLTTGLSSSGFSATYFNNSSWDPVALPPPLARTDATIDFSWAVNAPMASFPPNKFSARWASYLAAPASGNSTLVVDVGDAVNVFKLYLDDVLILEKTAAATAMSLEVQVSLNASQMHLLRLEYAAGNPNAAARLQWKTTTTALALVPASVAYPAIFLDEFVDRAVTYHRAAKFILGFKLSDTEINHFITYPADFGNIDFGTLQAGHWRRVYDYTTLRNAAPQAQALLTDVFAAANRVAPAPTPAELRSLLRQAAGWDDANLTFTAGLFAPNVADFKNEIALNRMREVMEIVPRTGLSAQTIDRWGAADTDFDDLNGTAQLLKNTVRAKYEEKDWLDLAGDLNDIIRKNQRDALVAYLLTDKDIRDWGAKDADGLFEYFLIDVQMGACMDTSRVVAANSAIQMFVSRCLLNLESRKSSGFEKGVSPGVVNRERWEWMKNYRVWEANRKVFLYPENWLEPDWRNDRSDFFKELESYLVQNDITDRSAEQAFRDYLANLNEVANLEVCGVHRETYNDAAKTFKYLHVFGRTHNAPYKFFYRKWNKARKWSAWEKVPLDIRCVESGDDSGVHVIPIVWKSRLFLFWPEFISVQEMPNNDNVTVSGAFDAKMSELKAIPAWEIRLAWSEHVEGKWSPKQLCKEIIKIRPDQWNNISESGLRWVYLIGDHQELAIRAHCLANKRYLPPDLASIDFWHEVGSFDLSDITSKVKATAHWILNPGDHAVWNGWKGYGLSFMNFSKYGKLHLMGDDYLRSDIDQKLLVTPTRQDYVQRLRDPFFFSDRQRTYFVRPVDITLLEWIQNPERSSTSPTLLSSIQAPSVSTTQEEQLSLGVAMRAAAEVTAKMEVPDVIKKQPGSAVKAMADASSTLPSFGGESAFTEVTFGGNLGTIFSSGSFKEKKDQGLEFHTFYHPYSSKYVQNLNQGGLPGLMRSDTDIPSDSGFAFENIYNPNFANGFVQKPDDFPDRTYYKENVCFDVYGANSIYNWELFFHAPLYIAIRLSKNGKFEEAMKWFHYIFDPTTNEMPLSGESEVSRYWKVLPFKTTVGKGLEDWFRELAPSASTEESTIGEWRDNPFDPHPIASKRPLAYMKHVVIKYVENLIAWGDSLFRQDTMESVNEALQIYVIANHILGPPPEIVPKRGEIKAESYWTLKDKWDDFSNALVQLENLFPFSSAVPVSPPSPGTNLLSVGSALYFCIPPNDKLLEYWDTAADRLFKIRHCQNIDGVERHLALFSPPIDPAALIQAASQGLSLGSILADLSSPPPIYRFTFLIQKANEFCSDVKALGSALLSAIEKKDGEELGRLRASQETQMLELMTGIKERQVLDAKSGKENLEKARETAAFRLKHYMDLLGNESVTVPAAPTISATLTADTQLPADTNIASIATDVDESLADTNERGVKLIPREKADLLLSLASMVQQQVATGMEGIAGAMNILPNMSIAIKPYGLGSGLSFGGSNIGAAISAHAKVPQIVAGVHSYQAAQAAKMAGYIRREQDWTLQANVAAREIVQLDKQITSADIRLQVTQQELKNHKQQIENAKATETFVKNKFTNQELYQWMKEQLFSVYKQSYNLAYDMAKKAEKAYKYEMGTELASFIQYGYWDNSMQGLAAGEKLQLALRQLENSYLEENRRELELSKSISLARLNPLALIQLRETGKCDVSVPEELFDLDFRGHYFRRLKTARLSIPCVAGPYASVSCSLRLLNNSIRINTTMNGDGTYEHENDQGLPIDDDRFRTNRTPVTAIAISSGQNDSGMFEFNFRDERYLPFERAGAISEWQIELSTEKELRQFDYSTISDVILHLDYTARETGGPFKEKATAYIKDFVVNADDLVNQPFMQMFSMRHQFSTEWHSFLNSAAPSGSQKLSFTLGQERFPFFAQDRKVDVTAIEVFADFAQDPPATMSVSYSNDGGQGVGPSVIQLLTKERLSGKLSRASFDSSSLDIAKPIALQIVPSGIREVYLVVHYRLGLISR